MSKRIDAFLIAALGLAVGSPAAGQSLREIYDQAFASNPKLLSSEATWHVSEEQERQALSALLPNVSVYGYQSWNRLSQKPAATARNASGDLTHIGANPWTTDYPGEQAGVTLRQVLFDLSAYFDLQRFEFQTQQSQEAYESAKQDLMLSVTEAYFVALAESDKLELIRSAIEATATDLKRIQALYQRQMARVTDLYEVEARHAALLTQEIEQQNNAAIALEVLRELAGGQIERIDPLQPDPTFPLPTQDVGQWVDIAQHNNHVLKAYDYAISAAEKYIAEQWAEHLPTINVSVSGTHANTAFNNLRTNDYDIGTLNLNATVPIYQGGLVDSKRREAEHRLTIAKEKREEQGRAVEKETRTAYLKLQAGLSRLRSSQRQVRAAEKSLEAMQKGFSLGAVTVNHVVNAQKELFEARAKELDAKYDYIKNHILLRYNAGVVSERDIDEVNDWLAKSR